MAILHEDRIQELIQCKDLIIESSDPHVPFDPRAQIKTDTVDLRLHPKALIYKENLGFADTLAHNPEDFFESITIPLSGFVLNPGHVLFGSVIEVVCVTNSKYQGRFSNRGTFSRFGISVTCGKMRFPAGTPGTPDVQIANHSSVPIKIYPYSYILQLQIETMDGTPDPYVGVYPKSIGPVPPILSKRDKEVSALLRELSAVPQPSLQSELTETAIEVMEKIPQQAKNVGDPHLQIAISPRLRSFCGLTIGALATLVGGFIVNMISQGEWSYWKYTSIGFASLLAVVLLALGAAHVFFGAGSD